MSDQTKTELRLSTLDQSPVPEGLTAAQALENSIALAKRVDALGYTRYWMSEHHAMDTLACTAPEIMLARIGAETERIRIGSGGIMLPHYTALKLPKYFGRCMPSIREESISGLAARRVVGRLRHWHCGEAGRHKWRMIFLSR